MADKFLRLNEMAALKNCVLSKGLNGLVEVLEASLIKGAMKAIAITFASVVLSFGFGFSSIAMEIETKPTLSGSAHISYPEDEDDSSCRSPPYREQIPSITVVGDEEVKHSRIRLENRSDRVRAYKQMYRPVNRTLELIARLLEDFVPIYGMRPLGEGAEYLTFLLNAYSARDLSTDQKLNELREIRQSVRNSLGHYRREHPSGELNHQIDIPTQITDTLNGLENNPKIHPMVTNLLRNAFENKIQFFRYKNLGIGAGLAMSGTISLGAGSKLTPLGKRYLIFAVSGSGGVGLGAWSSFSQVNAETRRNKFLFNATSKRRGHELDILCGIVGNVGENNPTADYERKGVLAGVGLYGALNESSVPFKVIPLRRSYKFLRRNLGLGRSYF